MTSHPQDDIIVVIPHSYGEAEMELEEWIEIGPGERELRRPTSAKSKSTNKELPLSVIPLRYRNNTLSRFLISLGVIENPWSKD
jgi:hypothetical protein